MRFSATGSPLTSSNTKSTTAVAPRPSSRMRRKRPCPTAAAPWGSAVIFGGGPLNPEIRQEVVDVRPRQIQRSRSRGHVPFLAHQRFPQELLLKDPRRLVKRSAFCFRFASWSGARHDKKVP